MLTSMLEKAIEIEGLLRVIRDGDPLPETYILLNMKAAELAEQAEKLEAQAAAPIPETPHADFVMEVPETPAPAVPEVVFTVAVNTPKEDSYSRTTDSLSAIGEEDSDLEQEDLSLIEEDDIILTFEDTVPMEELADFSMTREQTEKASPEKQEDGLIEMTLEEEKDFSKEKEEGNAHATEPGIEGNATPPESAEDENIRVETERKESGAPIRQMKLKSAFSLNDRYLYARELFEGNMKMFDSTLEFIEGIEDYSIIEDYFYSELEWNPEDSKVAAFMDILRPHFRE